MSTFRLTRLSRALGALGLAAGVILAGCAVANGDTKTQAAVPDLAPLPESKYNADMAAMGKYLFFDERLSGDAGISCATCHDPAKGWGDGAPLGKGYPASEHFRNTPGLVNARFKKYFKWDGQLDGNDLGTLVRNEITEAHLMNMDGRLMQERLKQVPEYNAMWQKFRKDDINGMRVFNVVGEFVKSLTSQNVPFDNYLKGNQGAISDEAKRGLALFKGKAQCISCHNGPMLTDNSFHRLGVPENPAVTAEPLRHITMARHYSTHGMPNYMNTHVDVGRYAITKNPADKGKFATPSLRELKYTAPYMHNGMLATLDDVLEFYNRGGGKGGELKPLGLSAAEKSDLKAFLLSLSGDAVVMAKPDLPAYQPRQFGKN
ncbi:cytochrome-c peroxidase [Sulfurivermis fontis]|uniref:cytochrome-c peroxidase n=1 Tax=Sulfurivermis fontis TaxID=1972068 RepID=UPI000FD9C784|nr:cytochrome c peroxidase [Sulfurivermis fontis]